MLLMFSAHAALSTGNKSSSFRPIAFANSLRVSGFDGTLPALTLHKRLCETSDLIASLEIPSGPLSLIQLFIASVFTDLFITLRIALVLLVKQVILLLCKFIISLVGVI